MHHAALRAGPRGAPRQGCRMLLALPLLDDGLTAPPLLHGLLVAGSHLLVHLQRRTDAVSLPGSARSLAFITFTFYILFI